MNPLSSGPHSPAARKALSRVACVAVAALASCAALAEPPASQPAAPASQPATSQPTASAPAAGFNDLADIELLEMEVPVVITAARRQQKLTQVPQAVTVITAEDIRRAGVRSVPDALRLAPGVDVAQLTSTQFAVSPRGYHGLSANETLVLVDGRQIFDAYFGGTLWGSWPFRVEDIERIEVIRGPGGVTWGANAANGVINIITKDPRDQRGFTSVTEAGSRGSVRQYLGVAHTEDRLRFRFSGEFETTDGFVRGGAFWRNVDDDAEIGRMSLHLIYDRDERNEFTFSAASSVVDGGMSATPAATLLRRRHAGSQANYILGRWKHRESNENQYSVTTFLNDFHFSIGAPQVEARYQQLGLQFTHTFRPAPNHLLTYGFDGRVDYVDASNSDPPGLATPTVSTGIVGLYIQDEWRFAPRWALNLGGRIDYDFHGGFEPSARAALSYELAEDHFVYGSASRSFAMPPGAARFLRTPLLEGAFFVVGDPDETAQVLYAYELGYRARLFDRFDTSVNLFWHEFEDIASLPIGLGPPGLTTARLTNVGDSSIYGIEWEGKLRVTDQLDLRGHYTYQQMYWGGGPNYHMSDQISPPKHKAMVGIDYSPLENLHLGSYLYYVDAVKAPDPANPFLTDEIDPVLRLDLRAEVEFWNERAALAVGVRNLLDDHHPEGSTLFLTPGEVPRMIYAELRVRIK